jgi:hypothetical protein
LYRRQASCRLNAPLRTAATTTALRRTTQRLVFGEGRSTVGAWGNAEMSMGSILAMFQNVGLLFIEEFLAWQRSIDRYGVPGLRVTRLQIYRDTDALRAAK